MADSKFAVAISAEDQFTTVLKRIEKNADELFKRIGKRASNTTTDIGRGAVEAGKKLNEAFAPWGRLFGLGGLAAGGLGFAAAAEGMYRFGQSANELSRSSARFGVSTELMQRWRGAARLAGLDAVAATGAIGNLNRVQFEAELGQNPAALAMSRALNLNLQEKPDKFLRDFSKSIQGLAPAAQIRAAGAFGLEGLIDLLRDPQKLDEFIRQWQRIGGLNDKQIQQGNELYRSISGAEIATSKFADTLAAELSPTLKPIIDSYSEWLADLEKSPAAMAAVETGAGVLATVFGVTLVSAVGRAIASLNAWWALPAVRFLAGRVGLATGIGAFIATMWPGTANKGEDKAIKDHPELYPGAPTTDVDKLTPQQAQQALDEGYAIPDDLRAKLRRRARGETVGPQGNGGTGGPQITGDRAQNAAIVRDHLRARGWTEAAIRGALANGIVESGLAAWGKPGAAGERGIWQFHPRSHLPAYSRYAGLRDQPLSDVGTQTDYMADWVERHMPSYPQATSDRSATDDFMRRFEAPANPAPGSRWGALDRIPAPERPAQQQDAGGRLPTMSADYIFGPNAKRPAIGGQRPDPEHGVYWQDPKQGEADRVAAGWNTRHEVTIRIPNAPPGTRANITGAEGPANVGVRVEYMMPPT